MLNLTNRNWTLSDNLKDLWQSSIDIDNNVDLTARTDPQCVVVSDQNRMFINGGFASKNGHLNNTNIMYNALENKWYGQPDYVEDPYGIRQMLVYISVWVSFCISRLLIDGIHV